MRRCGPLRRWVPEQFAALHERQAQLENAAIEERGLRLDAEARAAQVSPTAAAAPSPQAALGFGTSGFVDTHLLGMPERFGGQDSLWRDGKFVTKAYGQAALPEIRVLLGRVEKGTDDVRDAVLNEREQALSAQLYYMLALLTKSHALDKVQGAGEGEGLLVWRILQEQWEPRSLSRLTRTRSGILHGQFRGDAQNDIESWERNVSSRSRRSSSFPTDVVITAGILIKGLHGDGLRRHMVMRTMRLDTCDKWLAEVVEIARAKVVVNGQAPMDIDASEKGNGKGDGGKAKSKGKSKDGTVQDRQSGKGVKSADGKNLDSDVESYYCGKQVHRKNGCFKRKSELERAKLEGRPSVVPQSVSAVVDDFYCSSGSHTYEAVGHIAGDRLERRLCLEAQRHVSVERAREHPPGHHA